MQVVTINLPYMHKKDIEWNVVMAVIGYYGLSAAVDMVQAYIDWALTQSYVLWAVLLQVVIRVVMGDKFDRTLGFPGEGPQSEAHTEVIFLL